MSRLVLGVIGHVDHGKTALVRALTGIETDRLAEEQLRGISIALGFAHLRVGEAVVDLIDMPGHERFVRTMVAGATGIDAVLLVVAANEGIKPQTVEHVDIAGLLGIGRAIVAVTKVDLVGAEQAASVGRAAVALAEAAAMTAAPPVFTSALAGEGFPALLDAIAAVLAASAPPADDGFAYLPVDRCFSMPGHGTVVTGTLRRGGLSVMDELVVLPSGLPVRLRGLQVNGVRVTSARPGQRVAANLRGVERAQVAVGSALSAPGLIRASSWLSVRLRAVAGAPVLRTGTRLRLLLGTFEADARLRLLDGEELAPGQPASAQLHCAVPVAVPARERFILRSASPSATVAGGWVLDAQTVRQRPGAPGVLARLAGLAGREPAAIVRHEIEQAGPAGVGLPDLGRLAGLAPVRVAAALLGQNVVVTHDVAVARPALDGLIAAIPAVLAGHAAGLSREALQAAIPAAGAAVLDEAVTRLTAAAALRQQNGRLDVPRPAQERARAASEAAMAAQLAETIRKGGLTPPDWGDDRRRLLDRLVREGVVIRAPDRVQKRDVIFHRDAIEAARRKLTGRLADGSGLLVREAGEMLGISRKYSVPLLEYLDSVRFTRRVADRRVLAHRDAPQTVLAR